MAKSIHNRAEEDSRRGEEKRRRKQRRGGLTRRVKGKEGRRDGGRINERTGRRTSIARHSQHRIRTGFGGPSGERRCQKRQTAALGSAPVLTTCPPTSLTSSGSMSGPHHAPRGVTLTRRHKLFISRCSLMIFSLMPPRSTEQFTHTHTHV